MKIPRVIISATSSDSGKTLITAAILRIMRIKGLKVQPFKVGPDYIDPMYLSRAAGIPCRNLDSWIMDEDTLRDSFVIGSKEADLAVIEGVRGLYEGESPTGDLGSTAHVAKILSAPVILILDCRSLNRSAAAYVIGFQALDRGVKIVGVILNNVRDSLHEEKLRLAIQHYTKVPILGVLYRTPELYIKKRHLGLITPQELHDIDRTINDAARLLEPSLDIERILELARNSPEIDGDGNLIQKSFGAQRLKVGIFMDSAFSFYYHENLSALREAGADICVIDSQATKDLASDLSGILIGGGYPEVFASGLEANQSLRHLIRKRVSEEMPLVGECGGLIYLCRSINFFGKNYKMVGVFDGDVYFSDRPTALSYVKLRARANTHLSEVGTFLKGHEFHYSYIKDLSCEFAFEVIRGKGIKDGMDGAMVYRTVGMYTHLHYLACPKVPVRFLSACREYIHK